MTFKVYILYSLIKDRYYIGQTQDVERRLHEHNSRHSKSTRSGIPWKLVFIREFENRSDAVLFEMQLKRMKSRKYIQEQININFQYIIN
ncbi:MAG: GIY-YIG nuclease family protein [Candidatus Marinimicrobia bacterium]|nr:GIY-YIG nuclease family protein [Candidatus Neomarinimicrobiota bacterium]